jgi:hypothetical protein
MMFSRTEIAVACRRWGTMLRVPDEIDGARLLWALSGCESSFGANCAPRHEPYYHDLAERGTNAQLVALTQMWGCDAHSSFGPWQELLINCSATMRPEDFANLDRCALEAATFINRRILIHEHAMTVAQIADAYNSGTWRDQQPAGVTRYVAQCQQYYDAVPLPVS